MFRYELLATYDYTLWFNGYKVLECSAELNSRQIYSNIQYRISEKNGIFVFKENKYSLYLLLKHMDQLLTLKTTDDVDI